MLRLTFKRRYSLFDMVCLAGLAQLIFSRAINPWLGLAFYVIITTAASIAYEIFTEDEEEDWY